MSDEGSSAPATTSATSGSSSAVASGKPDTREEDVAAAATEPLDASPEDTFDPFAFVDASVSPREVTGDAGVSWFRMVSWTGRKPKIEFELPIFAMPSATVSKLLNDEIVARQTKTVSAFKQNYADEHGHAEFGLTCEPTLLSPSAVSVLCEYKRVFGLIFFDHSMQNWLIENEQLKAIWYDDVFEQSQRGAILKALLADVGRQRRMKPPTFTKKDDGELYDIVIQIPEHFVADRTGLTFVFGPRIVGSGADGAYTVVIPWDDARRFAKKGGRFDDLERAARDPLAHGTPYRWPH